MTKVLFIRYKKNNGILDGGEQVTEMHYDTLAQLVGKDNVETCYIHKQDKKRSILDYLRGAMYFPFDYHFGLTPKKVKQICRLAQKFDIVFIDRSVFGIIAKKLKENHYKGRVIVFFHNVEALYFDAKISKRIPFRNVIIKSADHNDAYSCRFADKVIALNRRDDDKLFERYQRHADVLIPIVFRDRFKPEHQSEAFTKAKPECLFLGSYFAPNNEGLLWFVRNVLPHVEINFKVVGKGMEKIKEEEPIMHDVEVIGSVPDLTPYINEADIMILPIFKGSGMKVKTCESLMFGKNILGTITNASEANATRQMISSEKSMTSLPRLALDSTPTLANCIWRDIQNRLCQKKCGKSCSTSSTISAPFDGQSQDSYTVVQDMDGDKSHSSLKTNSSQAS